MNKTNNISEERLEISNNEIREKLNNLVIEWHLTKKDIFIYLSLNFSENDIIDNWYQIKSLFYLIDNNIIAYDKFVSVIKNNNNNLALIKIELSWLIKINELWIRHQVSIMNILDIW